MKNLRGLDNGPHLFIGIRLQSAILSLRGQQVNQWQHSRTH
jgi:hypothetical protein